MNFPVPWRCLLPHEASKQACMDLSTPQAKAVDFVTYNNNEILTQLPGSLSLPCEAKTPDPMLSGPTAPAP